MNVSDKSIIGFTIETFGDIRTDKQNGKEQDNGRLFPYIQGTLHEIRPHSVGSYLGGVVPEIFRY